MHIFYHHIYQHLINIAIEILDAHFDMPREMQFHNQ